MAERIGDYLVRVGKITPAQVEQIIGAQKSGDARTFGQIAVGLGFVDTPTIDAFFAQKQ